jgi:hypothetical protein
VLLVVLVAVLEKIITHLKCKGVLLQTKQFPVVGQLMETVAVTVHPHGESRLVLAVVEPAQQAEAPQPFE